MFGNLNGKKHSLYWIINKCVFKSHKYWSKFHVTVDTQSSSYENLTLSVGGFCAVLFGFLHVIGVMRFDAGVDGLRQFIGQWPHVLRVLGDGVFIELKHKKTKELHSNLNISFHWTIKTPLEWKSIQLCTV